jgi:hypothetical protein
MEWKDKPLFGEEVDHPVATIDMEWGEEKHLFGKEVELGCRCSSCRAPGPPPTREPVNSNCNPTFYSIFAICCSVATTITFNSCRFLFH